MSIKKFALSLLLMIATSPFAISSEKNEFTVSDSYWYLGAKLGWSKYHNTEVDKINNAKINKSDFFGGGVFVGYQFNPYIATEIGYENLGEIKYLRNSDNDVVNTLSSHGASAVLKLNYPKLFSDDFKLYGKFGAVLLSNKWNTNKQNQVNNYLAPIFAGGISYDITKSVETRLEYQWIHNIKHTGDSKPHNGMLTVGLLYKPHRIVNNTKPKIVQEQYVSTKKDPIQTEENNTNINNEYQIKNEEKNTSNTESNHIIKPEKKLKKIEKRYILNADVLFNYNQSVLRQSGKKTLDSIIENLILINPSESSIEISGHSDRIGSDSYNHKLSEKRANSVRNYLTLRGVPDELISTKGAGKFYPVTGNKCNNLYGNELKNCLAPDRRVEIDIVAKKFQNLKVLKTNK